jgi:hypothetical protein
MLGPDEDVDLHADTAELSRLEPGAPVAGSPFRVEIDSGPAFAPHCIVETHSSSPRGTKRRRGSAGSPRRISATGEQDEDVSRSRTFTVEASSEVIWDICAYDLFGNAVTFKSDRFTASIERVESDAAAAVEAHEAASGCSLADGLGLPKVSTGRSSAADEIRERVRQRKAEQIWTRMSSTFTQNFGASGRTNSAGSSPAFLHVKQSKEPGVKEIRWTPDAVGRYQLSVALLSSKRGRDESSPLEERIAGSPFQVIVIPGRPSASHSRLLVGADAVRLPVSTKAEANTPDLPIMMSEDDAPHIEVPIRLLLCDRMGNVCEESLDAQKMINVRVEQVRLVGCESQAASRAPLLESAVLPGCSKGLLSLKLLASPVLLQLAALADAKGELQDDCCIVQLFVSANDRASRQRLLGSPARVQLELPLSSFIKVLLDVPLSPPEPVQSEPANNNVLLDVPLSPQEPVQSEPSNDTVANMVAEAEATSAAVAQADLSDTKVVVHTSLADAGASLAAAIQQDLDEAGVIVAHAAIEDSAAAEIAEPDIIRHEAAEFLFEAEQADIPSTLRGQTAKVGSLEEIPLQSGQSTASAEARNESAPAAMVQSAFAHVAQSVIASCDTAKDDPVPHQDALAPDGTAADAQPCIAQDRFLTPIADPPRAPDAASAGLQPSSSQDLRLTPLASAPTPSAPCHFLLPSPLSDHCPVRTPPTGDQELLERRVVQLPPLSPPASQPSPNARSPKEASNWRGSSSSPPTTDSADAPKRKSLDSSRALSWLPSSGLASEKRAGNQPIAQPASRRRTPALSAGLLRPGPLTLAPSPWPQAR